EGGGGRAGAGGPDQDRALRGPGAEGGVGGGGPEGVPLPGERRGVGRVPAGGAVIQEFGGGGRARLLPSRARSRLGRSLALPQEDVVAIRFTPPRRLR